MLDPVPMDAMSRLRFAEHVPSLAEVDARRLRGLPRRWGARVDESAPPALAKRANALANALTARGRGRDAAQLRRHVDLLERADELHQHASRVETLAQVYGALVALSGDATLDSEIAEAMTWAQAGALPAGESGSGHGPAFRATAELRNRAFRLVEREVARVARR
jgi:hypothetical protein